MITFLWMLYLAITLFVTIKTIYRCIAYTTGTTDNSKPIHAGIILTSLLWSIWYFYYLH